MFFQLPVSRRVSILRPTLCALLGVIAVAAPPTAHAQIPSASDIVISQFYVGGKGNSGSTYNQSYVELFNRTSSALSLSSLSLLLDASATGSSGTANTFSVIDKLTGTISSGSYYLIALDSNSGGTALPVTPDATFTTNPFSQNGNNVSSVGRIALATGTFTSSSVVAPGSSSVIDFVGYGTGTTAETSPVVINTSTIRTTSYQRVKTSSAASYYQDTNNNAVDFGSITPNPNNSSSAYQPTPASPTATCLVIGTMMGGVMSVRKRRTAKS